MKDEKEAKETWYIASCDSDGDGCALIRKLGTEEQIKKYIASVIHNMIHEDVDESEDNGWYGTEDAEDVTKPEWGFPGTELYAYAVFSDHHYDMSAYRTQNIVTSEHEEEENNELCD